MAETEMLLVIQFRRYRRLVNTDVAKGSEFFKGNRGNNENHIHLEIFIKYWEYLFFCFKSLSLKCVGVLQFWLSSNAASVTLPHSHFFA